MSVKQKGETNSISLTSLKQLFFIVLHSLFRQWDRRLWAPGPQPEEVVAVALEEVKVGIEVESLRWSGRIHSDRTTFLRKMHPDLIFPTCKQIHFKQTVLSGFSQNFVAGLSKLTFLGIINRIHSMNRE